MTTFSSLVITNTMLHATHFNAKDKLTVPQGLAQSAAVSSSLLPRQWCALLPLPSSAPSRAGSPPALLYALKAWLAPGIYTQVFTWVSATALYHPGKVMSSCHQVLVTIWHHYNYSLRPFSTYVHNSLHMCIHSILKYWFWWKFTNILLKNSNPRMYSNTVLYISLFSRMIPAAQLTEFHLLTEKSDTCMGGGNKKNHCCKKTHPASIKITLSFWRIKSLHPSAIATHCSSRNWQSTHYC